MSNCPLISPSLSLEFFLSPIHIPVVEYTGLGYVYDNFSFSCSANSDPHDTDKMAAEFLMQFNGMAFTEGQSLAFQFADKKLLVITVKEIEGN